ncbi:MAK10-like protein [Tanacetum coccineum]
MSRDVITVGSTMRISLLYRGEYSHWSERFMNYLEEQMDGEAIINSIRNGEHPLLVDALERHMRGSEYGEQDRKAAILYEYETFKATDEVFSIWKAFGGNTCDLGSFGKEKDKTTDLHQHLSRLCSQRLETASQITRDAVTALTKWASQESTTAQASNWLKRLPAGSITTWEDLTTRFLAQFFPSGRTTKLRNDILMFQQHHGESLSEAWIHFKDLLQKVPHHGIDLWLQDLALYDNKSWNDPRDFAKPVKEITLPQDFRSTSDRHLIELENQVQRLMEAHLALTQPTQVNKINTSCEICNGPYDTQYCIEDPEQAFVEYASSRIDKAGEGLVSDFMASQDARLSKFEANFKQQQSEMTKKIDIVLKAITDRIAGTLPIDTVKNPKLSTYPVLSARSYPTEDPQCLTQTHGSINAIIIHTEQQSASYNDGEKDNN